MCQRKHTDWSCGHHTTHLSQCSDPPTCSCLAVLFGRGGCRPEDVLRIRDTPCPECRERKERSHRRSAERRARRQEMRASYDAHRASTASSRAGEERRAVEDGGREIWEGVVPGSSADVAEPESARVSERVGSPVDQEDNRSPSSRERSQVPKDAYKGTTAGNEWEPVSPRAGPSSPKKNQDRGHQGDSLTSFGIRWGPVTRPDCPGRAPEEWTCVPLY